MTDSRVLTIAEDLHRKVLGRLKHKGSDYSYRFNRLACFHKSAQGLNMHPLTIAVTLMDKAILRLYNRMSPVVSEFDEAFLDEVIVDIVGYLSLIYALAVEELEGGKHEEVSTDSDTASAASLN